MADPKTPAEWLARAKEASGNPERMRHPLAHRTLVEIAAGYEGWQGTPVRRLPEATERNLGQGSQQELVVPVTSADAAARI
jgi:hypothetical protein